VTFKDTAKYGKIYKLPLLVCGSHTERVGERGRKEEGRLAFVSADSNNDRNIGDGGGAR
jgi:hypothetical protein